MHEGKAKHGHRPGGDISRRRFLERVGMTAASTSMLAARPAKPPVEAAPEPPRRKIKLGWIGCGSRGAWLAGLFKQHGGYDVPCRGRLFPGLA